MAEKKNITRAQAIEFAINGVEHARNLWEQDADWPSEKSDEVIAILKKMHEQLVKPRAKVVSKARKMNENLAATIVAAIPAEGTTTKEIVRMGYPDVTTTQKAAAVMRVAEDMGLVRKEKDGKNITYVPVTEDAPEDTPED